MSNLTFPASDNTVRLRAIDTKTHISLGARGFIEPSIPGNDVLNLTSVTFLIEHPTLNKKVLFDCGARKDFENFSPFIKDRLNLHVQGLRIDQDVHEVVAEAGVPLDELDAMIWSHWHWDHTGAPEKYPSKVDVVVGAGFKESFLPGYPTNPNGVFLDANFVGRNVREIAFDDSFKIGKYRAFDYFGDGSFYLLDTPGHAIGHMCGFARTTPTTFVFLGGDICHFGGNFRPSASTPLPDPVPEHHLDVDAGLPMPCPCSIFTACHPCGATNPDSKTSPFFEVTSFEHSAYLHREQAMQSIKEMQRFDASPDVLVCIAHDPTLVKVLPFLNDEPEKDLNNWQAEGLKEKAQWGWLNELPRDGKPGRSVLVDGVWRDGKLVKNFLDLKSTMY